VLTGGKARIDYHAYYHMNVATPRQAQNATGSAIESLMAEFDDFRSIYCGARPLV